LISWDSSNLERLIFIIYFHKFIITWILAFFLKGYWIWIYTNWPSINY
jgi:hypothetical protein